MVVVVTGQKRQNVGKTNELGWVVGGARHEIRARSFLVVRVFSSHLVRQQLRHPCFHPLHLQEQVVWGFWGDDRGAS